MSYEVVLDYLDKVRRNNPKYNWWEEGDDIRVKMYGADGPAPDPGSVNWMFCADAINLGLRRLGKPTPKNRFNPRYNGGTRSIMHEFGDAMVPFRLSECRRGDVAFVDFETRHALQGHVGICTGGPDAPFLQSYANGYPQVEPGFNNGVTIEQSHAGFFYTHRIPRERIWGNPKDDSSAESGRTDKAKTIDSYFANNYEQFGLYESIGEVLVDECERMGVGGLWISTAAALVEQESGGRNVFGMDYGATGDRPPYARHLVTKERVRKLIANDFAHGMNGVGLTQLTWWSYVLEAERMGGAHLPRFQMRVGFKLLNDLLSSYPYLNALEAYNSGRGTYNDPGNSYDTQFAAKHRAWKHRLN